MATTRHEYDRESLGDFIGDVVDAATTLAERATGSAAELAGQAVRDARRVAVSFEALIEAAAREGVDIARDTIDAVREAAERAEPRTHSHGDESRPDLTD